jgi:diguanylate cyclase (GGDEF)-like protein
MKRLIPLFAIILGCASAAWAAAPATLTTLRAIHALTNAEASQAIPVAFEATVVFYRGYEGTLFVQDSDTAVYVQYPTDAKLDSGDRIFVRGTTQSSYHPIVISNSITLLRHNDAIKPVPASFDDMISGRLDCMLVTLHAVIRTADLELSYAAPVRAIVLKMLTDGGYVDVDVNSSDPNALKGLLDAEVEVTGVASGHFDGKMQQTGVLLHVSSLADVKILKRATSSPWALPITPMDEILNGYDVRYLFQRIRVHGTITYYQPGSALVLESGPRSLWIMTRSEEPLRIGDQADVTGYPDIHDGFLSLSSGEVQELPASAPITPRQVSWRQLASSKHIFDLVSIEGQVVTEVREASQDEYVLVSDGQMFSAIYRHPDVPGWIPPPIKQIPLGSRVRVAGICMLENSNPYIGDVPFNILMRSLDDIVVVARPSLLTVRNLILLVGLLLAVVFAVGIRGWAIEHRVRRQIAALGLIEQRRSRILEDINGSRPLAEIVEEITELVSFKLRGAPCWCQIFDGAQLGNCPPKLTALRIVHAEIPAHAGSALGTIFAAFDPHAKPSDNESGALSMAAALTALAIETRRLYTDLLHRSEFDLLTNIHNRFSLDKYLDRQIEEARLKAGIFGLIYIDLDKFKQVNDLYGHQFGDLYLQEVALRMKRQLRNVDMVARLGGDEFAVLLPLVRNRAKVEEIALRLERSFEEPFTIEGRVLHGVASVGIALYPEDGATRDALLSAADAAMYAIKHTKCEIGTRQAERRNS